MISDKDNLPAGVSNRQIISIGYSRLRETKENETATSKSSRSVADAEAADGMGTACTRVGERVLSSIGKCVGAAVHFETSLDIPNGGVLCALPAVLRSVIMNPMTTMEILREILDEQEAIYRSQFPEWETAVR